MNKNEIIREIRNNSAMGFPGIYLIYRKSDHKPYVGQTKLAIRDRLIQHINNVYVEKESESIDAAIQKEGADKFEYVVVQPMLNPTAEQLNFGEVIFIDKYNSKEKGYNKTVGNHKGKFTLEDYRTAHVVTKNMMRDIVKNFKLDFEDKKVLIIGTFNDEFVDMIKFNTDELEIIDSYTDGSKDLAKEFKKVFEERMKEMENKEFDIIISNPPYGKIGCEITKNIIDNIEYKEFINLLPANDYIKRGKKMNLWQYADINSMKVFCGRLDNGFDDAAVTTHVARILKKPNLFISADEFEIENFIDPSLTKFFYENNKRKHDIIDNVRMSGYYETESLINNWSLEKSVVIAYRDICHGHMPFSKNCTSYKFNHKNMTVDEFIKITCTKDTNIKYSDITFKTESEKDNFVKFMYSEDGFRFYSKLWTAMNIDGGVRSLGIIKVDWTREWTVEEILKDYGYTDKEIKEVMDDLVNFKGMNK